MPLQRSEWQISPKCMHVVIISKFSVFHSNRNIILLKFIQFTLSYWNFGWIYGNTRSVWRIHWVPPHCTPHMNNTTLFWHMPHLPQSILRMHWWKRIHVRQIFAYILHEYDRPRIHNQFIAMRLNVSTKLQSQSQSHHHSINNSTMFDGNTCEITCNFASTTQFQGRQAKLLHIHLEKPVLVLSSHCFSC